MPTENTQIITRTVIDTPTFKQPYDCACSICGRSFTHGDRYAFDAAYRGFDQPLWHAGCQS